MAESEPATTAASLAIASCPTADAVGPTGKEEEDGGLHMA